MSAVEIFLPEQSKAEAFVFQQKVLDLEEQIRPPGDRLSATAIQPLLLNPPQHTHLNVFNSFKENRFTEQT